MRLLFKTLSRAPLGALYALSGVLYLLAYYVARHRHQVIREQLAKVFPSIGALVTSRSCPCTSTVWLNEPTASLRFI